MRGGGGPRMETQVPEESLGSGGVGGGGGLSSHRGPAGTAARSHACRQ